MKLLLVTMHAKYVHSSLALPCLAAACGHIPGVNVRISELTVNEPYDQLLKNIFSEEPDVVAFSCYIWNIGLTLRLAADLKKVRPEIFIVLGGPEASFGVFEMMGKNPAVDCVVRGEGEETFAELVAAFASSNDFSIALEELTEGATFRRGEDLVALPERPVISELDSIPSPFAAGQADLGKPLVYYETSRGCPFSCAFCMSSLEKGVRSFSFPRIEHDLKILMDAEAARVKLVDRTFNYDPQRAGRIWEYIIRNNRSSSFHFEIAADLLTEDNIRILSAAPAGMFRFEIGVQSENPATLARVGRKSDLRRLLANVDRLRKETGVTVHLDLVAGLPHEDLDGFLRSLDTLFHVCPHHIQVEPLKVLKGAPMRRIAKEEEYRFSDDPPYKILQTPWLSFADICHVETVARLLDLYYNSGRFSATLAFVARTTPLALFFSRFARFWGEAQIAESLSLQTLFEVLNTFLSESMPSTTVTGALCYDFCLAEYPLPGRLPSFFPGQTPPDEELRRRINLHVKDAASSEGGRIRTFIGRFPEDFRSSSPEEEPVTLLFLYIAAQGQKMKVRVLQM